MTLCYLAHAQANTHTFERKNASKIKTKKPLKIKNNEQQKNEEQSTSVNLFLLHFSL